MGSDFGGAIMSAAKVTPIRPAPEPTVSVEAMDEALNSQRCDLFQAMGIVRMASDTVREPKRGQRSLQDAWAALDGAYELLTRISDRLQDTETMLAKEVDRVEY
jgi:hypothetical protein